MKYLKEFIRWCLVSALILALGVVMLSAVAVLLPLAGLLSLIWYVCGWLAGAMYFAKSKKLGETESSWLILFRWDMIQAMGRGGPVSLAECVCLLCLEALMRATMDDLPKKDGETLLLEGPSK